MEVAEGNQVRRSERAGIGKQMAKMANLNGNKDITIT